jgi:hypothetical protein
MYACMYAVLIIYSTLPSLITSYLSNLSIIYWHHHLLLFYFQNTRAYRADQCFHVQLRRHELQSIVEEEIDNLVVEIEKHDQIRSA